MVCRRAGREFYFCRGWRGERDVWVCWERCRLVVSKILQPPPREDAAVAARAAAAELARLEPTFPVYLDLAAEERAKASAEKDVPIQSDSDAARTPGCKVQ